MIADASRADAALACTGMPTVDRLTGVERLLWEAGERALRQPQGKLALVLHISRLPAPRAHHVRVARVLLQDAAQRHGGQVFTMRNHDLVLLCQAPEAEGRSLPQAPTALPQTLLRLFAADAPEAGVLTSLWELEHDAAALHAYLSARAATVGQTGGEVARSQPISLAGLQEIVAKAPLPGLMVQQTGLSLAPDRGRSLAARLAPAFAQISVDLERLSLAPLVHDAVGDPFLFRHFAMTVDARLMGLLDEDLAVHGRQLRAAALQDIPVLIELGLRAIVSPAFASLARQTAISGMHLWVAVSVLEAAGDLGLLEHARGVLRLTGSRFVLNRIDASMLELIRPDALEPDLIVLPWSAALRAAMTDAGFAARLRAGRARRMLSGVDGEQALAWGQAHDIFLFQGPFLDQIQAATRMQRCHSAACCTLRQCLRRAAALASPGRTGCANPALLAAGFGAPG